MVHSQCGARSAAGAASHLQLTDRASAGNACPPIGEPVAHVDQCLPELGGALRAGRVKCTSQPGIFPTPTHSGLLLAHLPPDVNETPSARAETESKATR